MIFDEELSPGAVLVFIPVVIVLVIFVVDPDLDARILGCGQGQDLVQGIL